MDPLELIYYAGYSLNNALARRRERRLPNRVISVGNITTGGTGKTPAVIAVAEEAKRRGYMPCILTRGYRGKSKGPCFVNAAPEKPGLYRLFGDEPLLMAERLRDVPVVKSADRYEGGMFALNALKSHNSALNGPQSRRILFILDDGYQHRSLYRDIDILLIDSTNPFGRRKLLPTGILREPVAEIRRAGIIVLTKTNPHEGINQVLIEEIRRLNPHASIYTSEHRPCCLTDARSGKVLPLDLISNKPLYGFCGTGSPDSFRNTLIGLGAELRGFRAFRDHCIYTEGDLASIGEDAKKCGAEWIATTEKDIIRLRGLNMHENLYSIGIEFKAETALFTEIFREG